MSDDYVFPTDPSVYRPITEHDEPTNPELIEEVEGLVAASYRAHDINHAVFLDINWQSGCAQFQQAVDDLYNELDNLTGHEKNIKKHLRILLIQVIRNRVYDRSNYIIFPKRDQAWSKRFPNPLSVTKKIKDVFEGLRDKAFMTENLGYRNQAISRSTRISPLPKLLTFLDSYEIDHTTFQQIRDEYGGMRLKDPEGKIMHYNDDQVPEWVISSREKLKQYNEFIQQASITLKEEHYTPTIHIDQKLTYRVFNNGNLEFKEGGRFYGGWWVHCEKEYRPHILINNEEVIELDYTANHIYLAYGLNEVEMPAELKDDPYTVSDRYNRKLVKLAILIAINAASDVSAYNALINDIKEQKKQSVGQEREYWSTTLEEITDTDETYTAYRELISTIISKHPVLDQYLHTAHGREIQYLDSKVAEYILTTLTEQEITCLGIHDSFIVPCGYEEELRAAMTEAYNFLGIPLALPPIHT